MENIGECLALDRGEIWRVLSTMPWRNLESAYHYAVENIGEYLALDRGKIWRVLTT